MIDQRNYVSIKHLADKLGMHRSHARRYIIGLGIKPKKQRTEDSGSQLTLTVTAEEAETILRDRAERGFTSQSTQVETEAGVFYAIQLVPELDPRRIKLGFAIVLQDRLLQHRTAAPTAKVLKSWPCKRSWEVTVMDCLTSKGCKHILNEVFEFEDLEGLIKRGDDLFRLFPDPKSRPDLSEHAPYKGIGTAESPSIDTAMDTLKKRGVRVEPIEKTVIE